MQMIQNAARFAHCVCNAHAPSHPRRFSATEIERFG
jgi:hypothetical protein